MNNKLALLIMVALVVGPVSFWSGVAVSHDFDCDLVVHPGDSIQDAIGLAEPGDTICVEPGTYEEDLTIEKSLKLFGLKNDDNDSDNGSGRPIIKGVATVHRDQFPLAIPNIDIKADKVSIHGFIIESPEVLEDRYSSGIVLTGRNIKITRNYFIVGTGDISQAIQTYRQTNAPPGLRDISGLIIFKNAFTHLEPATGLGVYEGIFINPQSDPVDTAHRTNAVIIAKNWFSGNLIRAVTTQRSGTAIVKNMILTDWMPLPELDTFPRGIQLSKAAEAPPLPEAPSTHHLVAKNMICDKGLGTFSVGILVVDGVTESGVAKNFVKGAGDYGIDVNGDSNFIVKNGVTETGGVGIHLGGESEENKVIKNWVESSGEFDLQDEGTDNEFFKNRCDTSDPPWICCSGS